MSDFYMNGKANESLEAGAIVEKVNAYWYDKTLYYLTFGYFGCLNRFKKAKKDPNGFVIPHD